MTLGFKFLLWKNKNFWFQNNCRYVFSIAICSCETVWVKVLVSKGWFQSNYSTNTIIEKTNRREGEGGSVKDMEFSGG